MSIYDTLVSIFSIRYIIDSITNPGTNFVNVVMVIFIVCFFNIIIAFVNLWYNNKYSPNTRLRFRKYLNEKLYLRSLEMDISQFDNPTFYNDYTFVINDAENRSKDCGLPRRFPPTVPQLKNRKRQSNYDNHYGYLNRSLRSNSRKP